MEAVNAPMTDAECAAIRTSIRRDRPLGTESWVRRTAEVLGLGSEPAGTGASAGPEGEGSKVTRIGCLSK